MTFIVTVFAISSIFASTVALIFAIQTMIKMRERRAIRTIFDTLQVAGEIRCWYFSSQKCINIITNNGGTLRIILK